MSETYRCPVCNRPFEVPRLPWSVRCCPLPISEPTQAEYRHAVTKVKVPKRPGFLIRFRSDSDTGLGDTVERLIAMFGGKRIEAILKRLGINCGCGDRKAWLNRNWPY